MQLVGRERKKKSNKEAPHGRKSVFSSYYWNIKNTKKSNKEAPLGRKSVFSSYYWNIKNTKKSNKEAPLGRKWKCGAAQIAFIWIQGGERSLPKLPLQTIVDFAQPVQLNSILHRFNKILFFCKFCKNLVKNIFVDLHCTTFKTKVKGLRTKVWC